MTPERLQSGIGERNVLCLAVFPPTVPRRLPADVANEATLTTRTGPLFSTCWKMETPGRAPAVHATSALVATGVAR